METKIIRNENRVEVSPIGRLDTLATADFNAAIEPFLTEKSVKMTINCEQMEYIASSGLRLLLTLYKALTAQGGSLTITAVQPAVMQVLKMTGFDNFLKIE